MGVSGCCALKMLLRMTGFLAFALVFIHGLNVAVRWWKGLDLQSWEYPLLAVLPFLLAIFITRFSIFRKDCEKCHVDNHD